MISKNELRKVAVDLYDIGAITSRTPRTSIYINLKQLISHPQLLARLSRMLWSLADPNEKYDKICGVPFDALSPCGVPYTAITYAFHISTQNNIPMLMRGKKPTCKNAIEGQFQMGDRVAIVEDEITNGSNILELVVDLVKQNLKIGEALVVIDREQGGRENLENAGVKVKSLFKINELIGYLCEAGKISAYGRAIRTDINAIECAKDTSVQYTKERVSNRKRGFA